MQDPGTRARLERGAAGHICGPDPAPPIIWRDNCARLPPIMENVQDQLVQIVNACTIVVILLGTDVSGHVGEHRHAQHIAFVLGTLEGVNRVYRQLGVKNIHMTKLRNTKRDSIVRRLQFGNDVVCVCAYADQQNIINATVDDPSFVHHKPQRRVHKHFGFLLWNYMRDTIEPFAAARRCEVRDITVQCDLDMHETVSAWGMNVVSKGKAYELADVVGWCNGHKKHIKGCREVDLRDRLLRDLRRDMLK